VSDEKMEDTYVGKLLFITEVGSRMWGMEEISSDHNLFICYLTSASEYLRTGNFHPTKPQKSFDKDGVEYDVQQMEIGHLINLLIKGNVNAIWAVCSPIVVEKNDALNWLRRITINHLSKASYHSIRGMALSQYNDAKKRADTRDPQKSLKTAMRTIWFGCNMLNGLGVKFTPVTENVTETMIGQGFTRLQESYQNSQIREKPDENIFREFLLQIRLNEFRKFAEVDFKL
jgi:predicted nucleotidyltransferase